ncbi:MAG: YqbH/XkdH family protein [Oscillospiraceae bacterium]|nr:YqbH/XkdH family protein [Oscillospiraceae bacterium]
MSLEALLNHTCDIYHIKKEGKSPGYGLAASPSFSYPEEPDIAGQTCHFGIESRNVTVTQTAPANLMDAKIKLTLPIGTDVRLNDKIIDCATGLAYTAEQPVNVRGHHLFVYIKREEAQKPL